MADDDRALEPIIESNNKFRVVANRMDNNQLATEIGLQFVSMVKDGVGTALEVWKGREATAQGWEQVHQQLALMDKDQELKLKEIELDLAKSKDTTEKLRILLDHYVTMEQDRAAAIASAIAIALENLTKE